MQTFVCHCDYLSSGPALQIHAAAIQQLMQNGGLLLMQGNLWLDFNQLQAARQIWKQVLAAHLRCLCPSVIWTCPANSWDQVQQDFVKAGSAADAG